MEKRVSCQKGKKDRSALATEGSTTRNVMYDINISQRGSKRASERDLHTSSSSLLPQKRSSLAYMDDVSTPLLHTLVHCDSYFNHLTVFGQVSEQLLYSACVFSFCFGHIIYKENKM